MKVHQLGISSNTILSDCVCESTVGHETSLQFLDMLLSEVTL